ncbi:serine/threonine protein kinase [Gammaproteobacteria bacterium AS21]
MQNNFSHLQPNIILDAVENFGFEVSGQSYPLNSYENRVFQVGLLDNKSVIAKFYRPNRWAIETLQEEHDFSNQLAAAGVAVAANLQDLQGNTVHQIEGFYCSLQHKIIGREPELEDLESLFQIGQVLGQLHQASARLYSANNTANNKISFKHRPVFDVQAMGQDNVTYLLANVVGKKLSKKWLAKYQSITQQLLAAITQCLPDDMSEHYIAAHGDCHLSNVLMSASGPVLLDFDDAMLAPPIQDVWMFLAGDKSQHQQQLSELIEGYEEYIEFPHQQLSWIPAMRALRVINYTTWLAKRWSDSAFPIAFPWFNSEDFWMQHVKELEGLLREFSVAKTIEANGNC